jgi:hypothetical protein
MADSSPTHGNDMASNLVRLFLFPIRRILKLIHKSIPQEGKRSASSFGFHLGTVDAVPITLRELRVGNAHVSLLLLAARLLQVKLTAVADRFQAYWCLHCS